MIRSLMVLVSIFAFASVVIAGPRVDIVIGEKAPALERLAADELSSQLKRVYEAEVKIASTAPADAPHVIFVGSPDTNASMKPFADSWPNGDKKLTDQGHLLRSVTYRNRPALLIGGGGPVATYWAVAEFGHRLGIRSMLFGDLDPVSPPLLTLDKINIVKEPIVRSRAWYFRNSSRQDEGAWSIEEYRRVIQQLAKLRFNQITILIRHDQAYHHLEYAGIKRATDFVLAPISVSGDTSGRKAFGGAKVFEPPAFSGTKTYVDRHEAAKKHLRGIIAAAHEFGMTANVQFPFEQVPKEFNSLLSDVKGGAVGHSLDLLGWKTLITEKTVADLFRAHIRSLIETYPNIDGVQFQAIWKDSSDPEELGAVTKFFSQPGLLRRADGRDVHLSWLGVADESDESPDFAANPFILHKNAESARISILNLVEAPYYAVDLPRIQPKFWQQEWQTFLQRHSHGFEAFTSNVCDDDLAGYWLSRVSLGESVTPEDACRVLLTPTCGEEVDQRVWRAFKLVEKASECSDENHGRPASHYYFVLESDLLSEAKPPPSSWGEAKGYYLDAMNEMYRANTRAREGGRAFTLYFARRFEFAFEYMNCIEAVRNAAVAKEKGDTAVQIAELEKAIESLNNALNAMAAVARSNSDRGLIAVLNENGYRPLKKRLAEAEAAAK